MKYKIYSIIIPLLSAIMPSMACADEPDSVLSLSQCRRMALLNNADIRIADNNLRAAVETRREAFTKYFPEIAAGASVFQANHKMLQYDVFDLFTLGIIKKGAMAGVWALQPVFAGGKIINGNKLAKVGEEAAELRRQQSKENVLLQTDALFWQLVTLKATRRTLESAVLTLDSLGSQVKAAVDAGVVPMNDYLKVELKRNSYKADIVDADNGIDLIRMLLSQQIGMGNSGNIDVAADVPDSVVSMPVSLQMDPSSALSLTNDYRLLHKNIEAKDLERRMEVGNYLPKVAIGAGWFYHNVLDQNHNFGAVMATVDIPLSGWWGGSHAIRRKTAALDNARTELDNLSQKLEIEIQDKWDNLTAAHRKMRIAAEAITQSKENLRLNVAYYDAGMSTITDLLEAQALYRQAQDDFIAAYGVMKLSESQYLKSTGRILDAVQ